DLEPNQIIDQQAEVKPSDSSPNEPSGADIFAGYVNSYMDIIAKSDKLLSIVDEIAKGVTVTPPAEDNNALLQAVRRVYHQNTTTITYQMYRQALEMRAQLILEDSRSFKNTSVRSL
ncbi:hypothetical protein LRR18_17110, partial [Mangrovimonas sp. AS39]|uniref:hypothetical protein n=1 Tax=Mangrovimonas futianensis TaxID=2895523 RepID=UPI001E48D36E